jgi:U3 small nucleolar RNA-associated protein MPP10
VENVQKLDLESESIKNDMDVLFGKLDTLCHSYYRPSNVEDEPKVIINKLAINLEEVGQQAIANPDENLLAPEEIVKHSKFVPKSKEERTKTDRLRQRRKKKKGQKGKLIIRKKASK